MREVYSGAVRTRMALADGDWSQEVFTKGGLLDEPSFRC